MTSEVDICNKALQAIGTRSSIAALTEASNEARQCLLSYGTTRDDAMRSAHWGFCKRTTTLTLLKCQPSTPEFTGTQPTVWSNALPPPEWLYEYAWPTADCLFARSIQSQSMQGMGGVPIYSYGSQVGQPLFQRRRIPFSIGSDTDTFGNDVKVILTNEPQALLVYTHLVTQPDLWDTLFQNVVVSGLAATLALALTGDKGLSDRLIKAANDQILEARVGDGNEGMTIHDPVPDWMAVRTFGGILGGGWMPTPYGPLFGYL